MLTIELALVDNLIEQENAITDQLVLLAIIMHGHTHGQLAVEDVEANLREDE